MARTPEAFKKNQDIDAYVRHEVTEIDLSDRRVRVENLDTGKEWWEPFDQLMVATGAVALRPPIENIDAEGIYGITTLKSGMIFKGVVDREKPRRGVVIGGGYIGLEMAEAMLMRGMEVSLVEMAPEVMGTLDPDIGAIVSQSLIDHKVDLYREEALTGIEVKNGKVTAVITENRVLPADIVVLGTGVRPNSDLAKAAGIPVGVRDGIIVNERQQTEIEGVWSAGDCVQTHHLISKKPFYVALGTVANKQGMVAGINIGGDDAVFPGAIGTAITKFMETEISRTGLSQKEIEDLGWEFITGKVKTRNKPGYYPGAAEITVKIHAEKGSGKLLGGQIVGKQESGKRIDTIATCLHAGFTVEQMVFLDLSYAPPFSPVWDPVAVAARKAVKEI